MHYEKTTHPNCQEGEARAHYHNARCRPVTRCCCSCLGLVTRFHFVTLHWKLLEVSNKQQLGRGSGLIKWNELGVHAMTFDDYPRLDMTADCVSGSSGDKLDHIVAYTNIPNWGVSVWSDCGDPSIREEVEVYVNTDYAVVPEKAYYYQVHYAKKQRFVWGEVNLTYQRDNQPTHDWLDKETYFLD